MLHRSIAAALAAALMGALASLAPGAASAADCGPAPAAGVLDAGAFAVLAAALPPGRLTIVCLGSSSTQGVGASSPGRTYPAQLAALLADRMPDRGLQIVNKGISGEIVADNLRRLGRDALDLRPSLVIWQVGTNDALRGVPAEDLRAQLADGIRRIREAGSLVALMDPQPLAAPEKERAVAAASAVIGEVARATGTPLFARHRLVADMLASGGFTRAALYSDDGLHMSDAGYRCLAQDLADLLAPAPRAVEAKARPAAPKVVPAAARVVPARVGG